MKIFKKLANLFQSEKKEKKKTNQNSVSELFHKSRESKEEAFMAQKLKGKKIKIGQANPKLTTGAIAKETLKGKSPQEQLILILESHGIEVHQYRNVPLVDTGLVLRGQTDQYIQMANRLLGRNIESLRNSLMAEQSPDLSKELNDMLPSARMDLHILEHVPKEDQERVFRVVKTTRYKVLSEVLRRPITAL